MIAANRESELKYKTPFFPYVTLIGIWVQVFCLVVIAFTDELRSTLYVGVPMMVVPMIIFKLKQVKAHKTAVIRNKGEL